MPKLIHVWQWGTDYAAEQNLEDICNTALEFGFDGIVLKCLDGIDWASSYFRQQDAPGSIDEVAEQYAYAASRGLAYYAGTNPLYYSDGRLDQQAQLSGELANVTDGLVLDVEPYARFWGANRPAGTGRLFMQILRSVAPSARVVFQPDPRPARLAELRPEEWMPYVDVIAGQHYWNDFGADPLAELLRANQLGVQWGKPVWPTLPGNAPVEDFPLEQIAGFPGLIAWRLGTTGPQVLTALGGLNLTQGEPPVPPEPPPAVPSYTLLANNLGYASHNIPDGIDAELKAKKRISNGFARGIAQQLRELAP